MSAPMARRWFKPEQLRRPLTEAEAKAALDRWQALTEAGERARERYPSGSYDSDCFPDRDDD